MQSTAYVLINITGVYVRFCIDKHRGYESDKYSKNYSIEYIYNKR